MKHWRVALYFCCNLFAVLMLSSTLQAQTDRIAASLGAGHILAIFPDFPESSGAYSLQLDWLTANNGFADEYLYKKPEYGLSLNYFNLGNNEILGQAIGLQGNFQTYHPLGKRAEWNIGFAFGGSYFTESYDYINNPENIMSGSSWAFMATGNLGVRFPVNEKWHVFSNLKYHHTSNAHLVLPNVGMNMLLVEGGVSYTLRDTPHQDTTYRMANETTRWRPYLRGFYGLNELGETTRPTNGPRYAKVGAAIGINYIWRPTQHLSAELVTYYDDANYTYLLLQEDSEYEATRSNGSAVMLLVGHEFLFGRFGFITQLGVNLYNPGLDQITNDLSEPSTADLIGRWVPGRFCLTFYPLGREVNYVIPMLHAGVKTHLGGADFLEMGIALQLGNIH